MFSQYAYAPLHFSTVDLLSLGQGDILKLSFALKEYKYYFQKK